MLHTDTSIKFLSEMIFDFFESKGVDGIVELLQYKINLLKNDKNTTLESLKVELLELTEMIVKCCFPSKRDRLIYFFAEIQKISSISHLFNDFINNFLNFVEEVDNEIILKVKHILKNTQYDNYKEINVNFLADKLKINRSYLSSLFYKKEKVKLWKYIKEKKINIAFRQLNLRNNTKKPTTISKELGFSNYSDFKKTFESCYLITPKKIYKNSKI